MPAIRPEDLDANLKRKLEALYVIHGDEPLAALEAADAIRAAARAGGYTEREVFVAERDFKWDTLLAANANLGLFGERKLIDLRIPSGKPGTEGAKALERYAADPNPDNLTIVSLPRLDRAAQSWGWFAGLEARGVSIVVLPVDREAMPRWIAARLARRNQKARRETLAFLIDRCEGNLLAARQEIEKLGLVLPAGELDHDAVEHAVADVARYDVFQLSETWLAGDAARALHILAALEAEGEALTLIVWQLGEDIHALAGVLEATRAGTPLAAAVRNARVWGRRQTALEKAARRVRYDQAIELIVDLARLDGLAKGLGKINPWQVLARMVLLLAGSASAPAFVTREA